MKKIYFLILFTASIFSGIASNAKQNDMYRIAEKHIEKVKNIVKTNAENLPLKSAQAQNHLDSITLDNGSMGVFYYNDAGLLTDYKGYSLNYLDELEHKEHQQFEYDNAGRETLFVLKFNDISEGWVVREKTETQYDANGNVTSELYWDYDFNKAEHPSEKYEYQYDGNEVRTDSYEWDESLEDWSHVSYSIIVIDGLRPVSGEIFTYDDEAEEFLPGMQIEYGYNSAGLETLFRLSMYDEETDTFIVYSSSGYEYDSNNRILIEHESMQIPGVLSLVDETRYTYENGNMVKKEEYSDKGYLPELERQNYIEYEYNGSTLFSETYFLGQSDGSFVSTSKYVFTYNTSVNSGNYYTPNISVYFEDYYHLDEDYHQFGQLQKVTHYTISDWDTYEMTETMVVDYFYSNGASVVLSSDANLSAIEIDGTSLDGFMAGNHTYEVVLSAGTETPPVVTATTSHAGASANINQTTDLPGEATITVMAEDGETSVQYTIQFTISVGVKALSIPNVEVYPMPFSNYIEFNNKADNKLKSFEIFTLDGKSIKSGKIAGETEKYSIETAELGNGVYILNLIFENKQLFYQRVVKR